MFSSQSSQWLVSLTGDWKPLSDSTKFKNIRLFGSDDMLRKVGNTWWGVSNLHQNWIFHHKYIYWGNIQSLEKTERKSKWSFLNHRAASVGDPGPRMGWWAGLLQDFQIPANFLPELLQLHDSCPGCGATQGRHQTSLSGKLPVQVYSWRSVVSTI